MREGCGNAGILKAVACFTCMMNVDGVSTFLWSGFGINDMEILDEIPPAAVLPSDLVVLHEMTPWDFAKAMHHKRIDAS